MYSSEAVTTASIDDSVVPTINEEITLAQILIQVKAAKPKVVTTAATTATTTRPKDRGVVVQEPSEFRVPQVTQSSSSKDKGKGIMIKPEVPLKRKDQIALDEQIARDIQAKLDAELLEEQKLARKQEEEANIALIESWENTQAMMEANSLLAERLQSKEREELTDEEKAKLFMELMEKRRKHFAALRAQEKRNKPPTKAQKRTQMSTYLKHMGGYTYKQLKGKSFDEIQKLFDKKESLKKQKVEEEKESDEVDEVDEVELKKLLVIKKDEDIAIEAIPLATKLPVIIDYKLHKEGMLVHYELIRADGSSKRYSSMIRMLQGIDREDLEALWRIVKAKYGDTRPEDEFERVLYRDLKVMFEPDRTSEVWRMLQGYRVTIWKLIDSSGVHFVSAAGGKIACLKTIYCQEDKDVLKRKIVWRTRMRVKIMSNGNPSSVNIKQHCDVSIMRTSKYDESNAYVLEDPILLVGNPVNELAKPKKVIKDRRKKGKKKEFMNTKISIKKEFRGEVIKKKNHEGINSGFKEKCFIDFGIMKSKPDQETSTREAKTKKNEKVKNLKIHLAVSIFLQVVLTQNLCKNGSIRTTRARSLFDQNYKSESNHSTWLRSRPAGCITAHKISFKAFIKWYNDESSIISLPLLP
ncbi:hypothetical protein Tco_0873467 [Tanacetum coccineum]|uniref:Uncharacterized protein n=1 Tax=Tanacetum coccineum TaxID=301880 RepID=A0ABQ5BM37_9ASTR